MTDNHYNTLLRALQKPFISNHIIIIKFIQCFSRELGDEIFNIFDRLKLDINEETYQNYCSVIVNFYDTYDLEKFNEYFNINTSHSYYPSVHPTKGRPKIEWLQCYHDGCMKKFSQPQDLIRHLTVMECYIPYYHKIHEEIKLTPEIIRRDNITKCPSLICFEKEFDTPEGLINHFRDLGIEPFWTKGETVDNLNKTYNLEFKKSQLPIIHKESNCISCYKKEPNVIYSSCNHSFLCEDCNKKYKSSCPICRKRITSHYVV